MHQPPGVFRSIWLLFRLARTCRLNRWSKLQEDQKKKRKEKGPSPRQGTPGKKSGSGCLLALVVCGFICQVAFTTHKLLEELDQKAHAVLVAREMDMLAAATRARYARIRQELAEKIPLSIADRLDLYRKANAASKGINDGYEKLKDRVFKYRVHITGSSSLKQQGALAKQVWQEIQGAPRRTSAGAIVPGEKPPAESPAQEPTLEEEPPPEAPTGHSYLPPGERIFYALAIMAGAMLIMLLLVNMGMGNLDLAQEQWSMEWLITLPMPQNALILAKLCEYSFGNPITWFLLLPHFMVSFIWAGQGWGGVGLALAGFLGLALVAGSLQMVITIWIRQSRSRSFLKNFQALCTLLGVILLFCLLGVTTNPLGASWLLDLGDRIGPLVALLPTGRVVEMVMRGGFRPWELLLTATQTLLFVGLALVLVRHLIRPGLVTNTGLYQGRRSSSPGRSLLDFIRGVVAKDLRLLLRDRNMLIQTLLVPIIIIAGQVLINPAMGRNILSDHRHLAAFVFGAGAYSLLATSLYVLIIEGRSLWLLYTLPVALEKVILRKASLWACCALLVPVAIICWRLPHLLTATPAELLNFPIALAGIACFSFIAAGLGVMGVNYAQENIKAGTRPGITYIALFIILTFMPAIYAPAVGPKLVTLALYGVLALALWQKVKDRAPYLLDPTRSPPADLSVSDGLIAILCFFAIQGTGLGIYLAAGGGHPGPAMLISYLGAGTLVAWVTQIILLGRRLPGLSARLGLCRRPEDPQRSILHLAGVTISLTLVAILVGLAWLWCLHHFGWLTRMVEGARFISTADPALKICLAILAIVIAPPCEEYLFRALLFRSLRRTWGPLPSILMSAGLFALVHPLPSWPPVFCLGVLAASAFELTGLLIAPIAIHAIYNGVVIWVQI